MITTFEYLKFYFGVTQIYEESVDFTSFRVMLHYYLHFLSFSMRSKVMVSVLSMERTSQELFHLITVIYRCERVNIQYTRAGSSR